VKKRARGLSEGQFAAALAESITLGATCLDDLAINRADDAQELLRGFAVPAPQTAGSFLHRFSLGHIHQLNKALVAIQRRAYAAAQVSEVTLDFDSTYIFRRSTRRQGVDRTYKKGYALHSLVLHQLENILDEQDLEERERLRVVAALESLKDADLDEKEEKRLWAVVQKSAPRLLDVGQAIVMTIATGEMRRYLGLPAAP
jgi:hypothetical protein